MLDTVAALLTYQAGIYFATDTPPVRLGNRHPTIVPYETFTASDGDFVLAVGNDDQWRRFCEVAGLDPDERFATNRGRVTRLRRAAADRRRRAAAASAPLLDREARRRRASRADRFAICARCSAIRSWRRATWSCRCTTPPPATSACSARR